MRTETDVILSLQRHVNRALPDLTQVVTEVENERMVRPFAVVSADGERVVAGKRDMPLRTLPVSVYVYLEQPSSTLARKAAEDVREALDRAFVDGLADEPGGKVPLWDYTGRPSVQRVIAAASPFTLALDGHSTGALPAGADLGEVADAVQAIARAAAQLPTGQGVTVAGAPRRGVYVVSLDGDFRGLDLGELAATGAAVEVLHEPTPDPWRTARDFLSIEAFATDARPDATDPRRRTVTAGMRLTWGRGVQTQVRDTLQGVQFEAAAAST